MFGVPLFETEVFRNQMCSIEKSTSDIVGTFRHNDQSFGFPIVIRCLGNCALLIPSLRTWLVHQVSVNLTTVATIPNAVHYSKTCDDFLLLPEVIVTSHPRSNDSPLNCVTFWSEMHCVAASIADS